MGRPVDERIDHQRLVDRLVESRVRGLAAARPIAASRTAPLWWRLLFYGVLVGFGHAVGRQDGLWALLGLVATVCMACCAGGVPRGRSDD